MHFVFRTPLIYLWGVSANYRLHSLVDKQKGRWAIDVSANWRIAFEFIDGDAYVINDEDYH